MNGEVGAPHGGEESAERRVTSATRAMAQQELGRELMFYDPQRDEVHVLNDTAKVVWEGMAAGRSEEQIAGDLRARFAVRDDHDVLADVRHFIAEFRAKGI